MKVFYSFIAATAVTVAATRAQTPPPPEPVGVGFVNAVGLPSRTEVFVDGQSVKPTGFAPGGYAASLGVQPGGHELAFANKACDNRLTQRFELKEGSSPLFVLYSVVVPQTAKNVLKLVAVPPQRRLATRAFFVFSTLEGRVATIRANGRAMQIQPLTLVPLEGATLTTELKAGRPIRYDPLEAGNYVLVLFEGQPGQLREAFVEMPR